MLKYNILTLYEENFEKVYNSFSLFKKKQSSIIQVNRISRVKRVSAKKFDGCVMHVKLTSKQCVNIKEKLLKTPEHTVSISSFSFVDSNQSSV